MRNLGYNPAEARRLQQALAARGFDPGPIDGVIGPRTHSAMRAFQQQQNLTVGRFDRETATALGMSDFNDNRAGTIDMSSTPGSGGQYSGPEHRASDRSGVGDTSMSGVSFQRTHDVIELQRALSARGFDPGPIDGVMGPQTRRALMSYQRQHNLAASGSLDRDTVASLGWKQRTGDLNDDRAGTIDMSSTPGSGGKYAGPERRSPVASRDSGSSGGGADMPQGGAGGR
jgi:peptidoglycan hydrolase-like protein with peptidoglycan-binding domain